MLTALVLALALKDGACVLEKAHYTLRKRPEITLSFREIPTNQDWPSGIAMRMQGGKRDYWFLPFGGNGQGLTNHLASALPPDAPGWQFPEPDGGPHRPPPRDMDYVAATSDYDFDEGFTLRPGASAPSHMFLPQLQYAMWYGPYDGMPYAFFDLTGCDR